MGSMHYRPMPRGYRVQPFFPTKVKISTIATSIKSGNYDVVVFFTDKGHIINAPIIERISGEDAVSLALQLLDKWADAEGRIEKCLLPTKRGILHKDFMGFSNLYCQLHTDRHELIALVKK